MSDDVVALILEAEGLAAGGQAGAARAAYERVLAVLPAAAPALVRARVRSGLAWTLTATGAPDRAVAVLDTCTPDREALPPPVRASLARLRGEAEMARGNPAAALAAYEAAIALLRADDAEAASLTPLLNLAGEAAAAMARYDRAAAYQTEAAARLRAANDQPGLARALASLGASLYRNDQPEAAEAALREALALEPGLLLAAENLIHVLYKRGRREEAAALARAKYRQQSFVARPAPPAPEGTLLALWSFNGTVPNEHLLDGLPMQVIDWHIQYADAAHEARLPPYQVVFNLIGDADNGAEALRAAADFARRAPAPMLNDPARVARTRRDAMPALLGDIPGLLVPRVAQFAAADLRQDAERRLGEAGLALPLLLRNAGTHGGDSVQRILKRDALAVACAALPDGPVYATQYVDYRSADGHYRKYRVIFVRGEPMPYHLAIAPDWLVHYFRAEMEPYAWKRHEELAFVGGIEAALGARALDTLRQVGQRTGLDYCGIDFSILPDGRLLLFECNATMLVHPEADDGPLAAKNPAVRRIIAAVQTMIRDAARGLRHDAAA